MPRLTFALPENRDDMIAALIAYHKTHLLPKYTKLMSYYNGKHDIMSRTVNDNKPNNRIASIYGTYIVNTVQGYMLGQPVKYAAKDELLLKELNHVLEANQERDKNVELEKTMAITGEAFELVYLNENAEVRFSQLPNAQTIAIYSDTLEPTLELVLRYYEVAVIGQEKKTVRVELYYKDRIEYLTQVDDKMFALDCTKEHYFNSVPVVHYLNNEETTGDFEKILPLMDDYDRRLSDNSNELEYFRNAYMVIKGFGELDEETLSQWRRTGAFLLPGNKDTDEDVKFITKDLDDAAVQSHLKVLNDNIHKFANIPNLTDEAFASNLSGVSLKFKLWGFENLIAAKERKFIQALIHRVELLFQALNLKGHRYDFKQVSIVMTRNIPSNNLEIAQMVRDMKDVVPHEELIKQIPFIEDVASCIGLMQKQSNAIQAQKQSA